MKNLKNLINQITEFGVNPNVAADNKTDEIQKLLVQLYSEFLNIKADFDEKDYEEEPDFKYQVIRQNVKSNFPDLSWYSKILDSNKLDSNTNTGIGDALDDLTDIIKDLLAIKWRMETTSEKDAIWHFELSMRTHSEQHLVDFLKYLKDKNG